MPLVSLILIHWIVFYSVDSAIRSSSSWVQLPQSLRTKFINNAIDKGRPLDGHFSLTLENHKSSIKPPSQISPLSLISPLPPFQGKKVNTPPYSPLIILY